MKRVLAVLILAVLSSLFIVPVTAQPAPRVPVVVPAADNNNASSAHPFGFDVHIINTGVEAATIEASEPNHSCAASVADSDSVWFHAYIVPGRVTLDTAGSSYGTAGGPNANTVISLYRLNDFSFANFNQLLPIACNDNGTSEGIINSFQILEADDYMIQISAAPGVTATGTSTVHLNATLVPDVPHPFDDPEDARKLKFPGLPAVTNISNATIELEELADPHLTEPITNTVWFKFTYEARRILLLQTFYEASNDLWFSVYQHVGSSYVPSAGVVSSGVNFFSAILEPGTYYLRVGVMNSPQGTNSGFITFTNPAYVTPPNLEFAVGETEGTPAATATLDGWKLKNETGGLLGDGAFCDGPAQYKCFVRLVSSGATEATSLEGKLNLASVKFKKGDLLSVQMEMLDYVGTPNFTVTLTFTDASGATLVFAKKVTAPLEQVSIIEQIKSSFSPVKASLKIKNKDTTLNNSVEIDAAAAGVLRVGEGVLRGDLAQFSLGSAAAGPDGVLPAPPPAQ